MNTRPNLLPFRLAAYDTLIGRPDAMIDTAHATVVGLGLRIAAVSAREGYLESRWFDPRDKRSHRGNTNPGKLVRLRIWTDLVTPSQSQVVVETVRRQTIDPSIDGREVETVVESGSAGDSLTQAVRASLLKAFTRAPGAAQ